MNLTDRKNLTGPLLVLALFISVVATLRYAQEFFLPLVLAGLLSFLLSPLVRRLERWKLGRVGAVLVTAAMAFVLIGGLTYLVTSQFLDLARSLPKYRSNLIARVGSLKTNQNNPLRLAVKTISEVTAALNKPEDTSPAAAEKMRPTRVEVVPTAEAGSIQMLMGVLWPVVGPLANTFVVIVIVIFMLMAGVDLRDRLLHLVGRARLRVTTQAFDEVGQRISRYLRAQLLVNASFGLAIGIGLYFIGIPNAIFWGLLGMVLRFLPYIGAWIAAALPLALAIAIFETWTQPLLTIGLFVTVELVVANVVEPWLYGASTEISPLAVVVSALFWTWLWGGVGLVLATPLTVCLAVAGKYLPGLAFLDLLVGEKPSIAAGDRLYQRLLALNEEEASEIIERHTREQSALSAFDDAVLPALRSIEADFREGVLSDGTRTEACHILRQIITDLAEPRAASPATNGPVLCIPASHEGDEIGALMLAQVLAESGVAATVLSSQLLAGESVEQAVALAPSIVCISSLPPVSTIAARALCKRLRARLPSAKIIVGLWQPDDAEFLARRERLGKAGADETYPDLRRAAAGIAAFAACTLPPGTDAPAADSPARS